MIAWNPETTQITVVPWPARGAARDYLMTGGACYTHVREASREMQKAFLFIDFNTIVVRDRVPVDAAHEAFLKIDEYRWSISPDMKGASGRKEERAR